VRRIIIDMLILSVSQLGTQHVYSTADNTINSCLTNLVNVYEEISDLVDEGKAVDFSKAFSSVSHKILIDKLMKCGLDKKTVRWIINWLNRWAWRVMIRGMKLEASNQWCTPGVDTGSSPV